VKDKLLPNIPNIVGIVVIFIMSAHYFVLKGVSEAATLLNWVTYMTPIITPLAVISILRARIGEVRRRGRRWIPDLVLLVVFVGVLIWGISLPSRELNTAYTEWYNLIVTQGSSTITTLMVFTVIATFVRAFRARNVYMAWTIFITIVTLWTIAPIADTVFPPMADFGRWIQNYVQLAVDQVLYVGLWVSLVVVTVNTVLMREKLRPR